jgi:plastocyanin
MVDPNALNGCSMANYNDKTADKTVEITWGFSTTVPSSCIKVKKGTKITWNGSLVNHPFQAKGMVGSGTNPIPATAVSTGMSTSVTFDTEGTFGYHCTLHSSMIGAILVVP